MMQPQSKRFTRANSYETGLAAEGRARQFLEERSYRILARRYRNPGGEIDIIARRGDHLAFIEVKGRKTRDEAAYSILPRQQVRIACAAGGFLAEHSEYAKCSASFDVILVTPHEACAHIENAFLA
jgi:putative endonuclease